MNQEPTGFDKRMKRILEKEIANWKLPSILPEPGSDLTSNKKPDTDLLERVNWLNIIRHPSTVLILEARGNGKSALGFKIPEYLRYTVDPYVVASQVITV